MTSQQPTEHPALWFLNAMLQGKKLSLLGEMADCRAVVGKMHNCSGISHNAKNQENIELRVIKGQM